MDLPQTYTISKFFTHTEGARQYSSYLNGGCPICHEGNSWGSKRRLYYYINDDFLYCYNCARAWNPYWWIKEITGMTFHEILEDVKDYGGVDGDYIQQYSSNTTTTEWAMPDLPGECINLKSEVQLDYYKNDKMVKKAYDYCNDRRLFSALNSPKALYVCIDDRYHKNRLIFPYYKENKIISYASRVFLPDDKRTRYLIKFNTGKPVFGLDRVDADYPYIFIFEGQIDSMFIKNGIAVSGLVLTEEQESELSAFPLHKRIWCLDNLAMEKDEVRSKAIEHLNNGESLFLYLNEFEKYKDLNEYCIEKKQDQVDPVLILNNVYSGGKGLMRI